MKYLFNHLLAFVMVSSAGFAAAAQEAPPLAPMHIDGATTVDYQGVIELIGAQSGLVVVDSRPATDYAHGHIETAINVVSSDMTDPEVLSSRVASQATPVMFYCQGIKCGRAAAATKKAIEWGYTNVYYYANGMDEWLAEGMPTVKE